MKLKIFTSTVFGLLLVGGSSLAADTKVSSGGVARVAHITGMDRSPKVLTQAAPVYPNYLRERGIQGVAMVEMLVDSTGTVIEARAVRSTVPEFGVQAVAAARQWTFSPAEANGQKISARIQIPFEFVMPQMAALGEREM